MRVSWGRVGFMLRLLDRGLLEDAVELESVVMGGLEDGCKVG